MSKTKAASKIISCLLTCIMIFCLFPKVEVHAEENMEIPITVSYRMNLSNDNGIVEEYINTQLYEKNPPSITVPETAIPGDSITIGLPTQTVFLDKENEMRCTFVDSVNNGNAFENIFVFIGYYDADGEYIGADSERGRLIVDDKDSTFTFSIPEYEEFPEGCVSANVNIYYEWGGHVYGIKYENSGYVTNWVESVVRTVRQDDVELKPETIDGKPAYNISDKENITVEYTTTMDMKNLSVVFEDDSEDLSFYKNGWWTVLSTFKSRIYDNTYVNIYLQFDEKLDLKQADADGLLDELKMVSNMFTLDKDPYTINGNELIIHCHWNGAEARAAASLDPIIEISGICLPVSETWTGNPVELYSEGNIEGIAYYSLRKDPNYGMNQWGSNDGFHDDLMPLEDWLDEYYEFGYEDGKDFYQWLSDTKRAFTLTAVRIQSSGGEDNDTFLLRLPDEPEEPVEVPEEDKPAVSEKPYLKINLHWEDEANAANPDFVFVDVYHEEEYYTTVEVFAKYGWMGGVSIPERWKDDDWWVEPKEIPEKYNTSIEETRQLVFNITNTLS